MAEDTMPNNAFRQVDDPQAALLAVGAVLRAVLERHPVERDRIAALLAPGAGGDHDLARRATWFVDWMLENADADRRS